MFINYNHPTSIKYKKIAITDRKYFKFSKILFLIKGFSDKYFPLIHSYDPIRETAVRKERRKNAPTKWDGMKQ